MYLRDFGPILDMEKRPVMFLDGDRLANTSPKYKPTWGEKQNTPNARNKELR